MARVHVLAVITTKSGMRDKMLEIFNANVPAVRAEDGCIEYGATIDHDERRRVSDPIWRRYVRGGRENGQASMR